MPKVGSSGVRKQSLKAKEKRASYVQSARDDKERKTTADGREKGVVDFDL